MLLQRKIAKDSVNGALKYLALNKILFKLRRVKLFIRWLSSGAFILLLFSASAQDSVKKETRFTLGPITVDQQARTVQFPATINQTEGALEYLLVTDQGKTHESLLVTKISPYQLQIALLLLGGQPPLDLKELPPEHITKESLKAAPELKGNEIAIRITFNQDSNRQPIRAEEWIHTQLTQAPMTPRPWIYTGSAIFQKRFLAQEEGAIISLITDPAALINNPRPGHDDDTLWSVQKDKIPSLGTPVVITLQLLTPKPQ